MDTDTYFESSPGTDAGPGAEARPGPDGRRRTGIRGELLARELLESRGHTVIEANWRCRFGEIDLITRAPDAALHIVEVRTRSGTGYGTAADSVTPAKQRRLRTLATHWLAEYEPRWSRVSFDVVTVELSTTAVPRLEHLEDVF